MEVPSLTFVVTNSLLISIHSSSISSSFCGKRFLGSQTPHYLLSVGRRPQNTHARLLLSTPPKMWPVILSEVGAACSSDLLWSARPRTEESLLGSEASVELPSRLSVSLSSRGRRGAGVPCTRRLYACRGGGAGVPCTGAPARGRAFETMFACRGGGDRG